MDINFNIFISCYINSYIIFPFKTRKPEIKKEYDFMKKMFFNNIKLGSHEETLPINIKFHSITFYIIYEKITKQII